MLIGTSGSRDGPTSPQRARFQQTLSRLLTIGPTIEPPGEPLVFRHGDCIGWDAVAHDIADELGFMIIIHPPTNPKDRAFKPQRMTNDRPPIMILAAKPYLARNRDIVDQSERVIICPDTAEYRIKSGTWYTWKYAREQKRSTLLIRPDGSTALDAFGLTW